MEALRRPLTALRILPILLVFLMAMASSQRVRCEALTATFSGNTLSVTIPYHAAHAGSGDLVMKILDPEDKALGRVERHIHVSSGDGSVQQFIAPDQALALEDLVWERVHYRFVYSGEKAAAFEGISSISQILERPVVHVLGQKSYLAGSDAAIRVIVTDSTNKEIVKGGSVRVELLVPDRSSVVLYTGQINRKGTAEAQFRIPAGTVGDCQLRYVVETPIGNTEYTQAIQIEEKASILLTTEKPIYQPGQTIHVRALALDRADHRSAKNRKLALEVEDSRGNKVFKKATETDDFGISSAEFTLADEVNLGTYHVRAIMGDSGSAATNTAEIAVNVERYVLPKFKVAIEFTEKDHKQKRDYRPGDHVTGTVRANYFFGKPVEDAEVALKASGMDVNVFEASSASGKTDKDGVYHFDLKLPAYFAGQAMSQGAARVLVEATAKDAAAHSETRGEPITVSQSALLITAVPEGEMLIPGLDNQVFVLTSYPDGAPANTQIDVHVDGAANQKATTDNGGVAVVHFKAVAGHDMLHIEADDRHGNRATSDVHLEMRGGEDQILLRAERAVYRTGERMTLDVFSTKQYGSAYVDIVKDGQTIVTRDVDIENGRASLAITATPEMAGTLDFNAYLFGRDAQPAGDHRLVFVQPANELHIETVADAREYKPGAEANIRFRVTDAKGDGARAALGVQVVDEAVFALAEKQPGFAKVFFYLEQEAMKPRYEIHSISMSDVIEPAANEEIEQRDRAARALFSATEMTNTNKLDTEFGENLPHDKYGEYLQQYQEAFLEHVQWIAKQLSQVYAHDPAGFDAVKEFAKLADRDGLPLHDAWGAPLRMEPAGWRQVDGRYYMIHSAGADQALNTGDDLRASIEVRPGRPVNVAGHSSKIDVKIEHDRGPFNGSADVVGTIVDPSGVVIAGAHVELRSTLNAESRKAVADAQGRFSLSAVPAGMYRVKIWAQGFETVSQRIEVKPRDRMNLSCTLGIGATTETVTVSGQAVVLAQGVVQGFGFGQGFGRGIGRGMGGGIIAGVVDGPVNHALAMNGRLLKQELAATEEMKLAKAAPGAAPAHVRSYFPEALYINPEIITDGNGMANITVPIADSITTWRMAMLASTESGALGTSTSSLKVFQDFFVDLDLPVTLTQGDRVSIPVAIYNYSGERGDVSLKLEPEDWYALVNDSAEKSIAVEPGHPGGSQFTLEAKRIGKFKLTLSAKLNGKAVREDIVVREIEVVPNGREQNMVFNGHLDSTVEHSVDFPTKSIPDASKIFVRLYPGPLSQVIEGMDSILRMPSGCFEQTSSSTYPNVLALDYMKRTKKLTPEVHAKAEGFIANGYQRLLTFEVSGGGFSWFGQAPANKILTAYGLMEFSDMAKVYDVDPRLISRTQQWLADQQQPDGSWKPDSEFINEGATNRYNSDVLRITAYIAWALENSGYQGASVEKAKQFIEKNLGAANGKTDTYTLAVLADFAVEYGKDREFTQQAMQLLLDARTETADQVSWSAEETGVYSTGASAAIETTGLAAQALLKWGQAAPVVRKALNFITSKKGASGNWGTTQATIMALRAMLLASEIGTSDVHGSVEIALNGKTVESLQLTPENNDLLHQFVFKDSDITSSDSVQIRFHGTGGLAYQVAGTYFVPWDQKPENEMLSIDVTYDRTKLAQNDLAMAMATIKSNLPKTAKMVMVDLGIPPGFDLLSEDLQDFQEKSARKTSGRLEKFSLTATQAILYFDSLAPHESVTLRYRLRAKYPIHVRTFESRVYEYYDPAVNATAQPVQLEVSAR
jgi:uncharacterized protein YfaS (alpha-2-macroglobulin family)